MPNGTIIPKDTGVLIPNLAFQRDSEYFPDPLKFDPERFSTENKNLRHPFASLPFGEGRKTIFYFKWLIINNFILKGPRFCIGMRFGLLETRLGLALLLKNFKFMPCTRTENPITIDPVKLVHCPKGDVWLKISKV